MGVLLSVVISYAGVHEAIECVRHIISGVIPDTQPDFQDLVEYYTSLLRKSANQSRDWIGESQGYLCLTEDKNGKLRSAAVKYYNDSARSDSTALLFSTKISSFGQESFEENTISNGGYGADRYSPTKTKTIVSNTSESFSIRHRSPVTSSIERTEEKEKLSWLYQPQIPTPQTPEIHFQSYDDDKPTAYSEEFLRSLDGIKFRPLQRSDPSGRRRSFKKRNSSSSTSSKDSRASREEELKMFTSLEEAEFERMNRGENFTGYGSAPNLSARSYSRSRSRERKSEHWSVEASVDSSVDDADLRQRSLDKPKLDSLEEPKEKEVIEEEEEVDFWGSMAD
ncbi:hypothetical protein O3G_MSEX014613 [Manduca sexta]|uniref:Uncharacterized protein n=1 Tax=Manduca sexta TaxID=7130 RepID=A0A921ZVV6_MANSE|nr:hypothetical protein O3G_MSEX014613 [Manduca sexta]